MPDFECRPRKSLEAENGPESHSPVNFFPIKTTQLKSNIGNKSNSNKSNISWFLVLKTIGWFKFNSIKLYYYYNNNIIKKAGHYPRRILAISYLLLVTFVTFVTFWLALSFFFDLY